MELTLSWLVMESCWFVGVSIGHPLADFAPNLAKALWVVNHEYLLKGRPFTWSITEDSKSCQTNTELMKQKKNRRKNKRTDLWSRVHRPCTRASGPNVSVREARFAVQTWVAVSIRHACLSQLKKGKWHSVWLPGKCAGERAKKHKISNFLFFLTWIRKGFCGVVFLSKNKSWKCETYLESKSRVQEKSCNEQSWNETHPLQSKYTLLGLSTDIQATVYWEMKMKYLHQWLRGEEEERFFSL